MSDDKCPLDEITVYWCDSYFGIHWDGNQGEWNGNRKQPATYVRADRIESLERELAEAKANFEAAKLCTRCGSKYDGTGTCSNKPCQGGIGEWCIEHHGTPFSGDWNGRDKLQSALTRSEARCKLQQAALDELFEGPPESWAEWCQRHRAALATEGDDKP